MTYRKRMFVDKADRFQAYLPKIGRIGLIRSDL